MSKVATTRPVPPTAAYGMLLRQAANKPVEQVVEQIRHLGYAVLDLKFPSERIDLIAAEFESLRAKYVSQFGQANLQAADELNTIRAPLLFGSSPFLDLALDAGLHQVLSDLILGLYILNQQNGIINPVSQGYNQGAWHRDLPYQHFVSSRPLAINALYCIDDFTSENGATFVLPASHKMEAFPSEAFVQNNAMQIEAKAGSFILLDCMLFHAGGFNHSSQERRAINHVFNIPYFKQMIHIPGNLSAPHLSDAQRSILGFRNTEAQSVLDYLKRRGLR